MKIINNGIVIDNDSFQPHVSLTILIPIEATSDLNSANVLDAKEEYAKLIGEEVVKVLTK